MLKELDTYDWGEVFKYANPEPVMDEEIDCSSFTREDVAEILYQDDGYNDGESWIMVGRLKDKRYFFISAWCDYTGWG